MYCSQHEYEYFLYTTGNRNFSNVFFSKNILFYNMIVYIIVILWYSIFCIARLTVSTNVFVQRVTETSNVFFSNPYFLNWLSHVLVERLTWNLEEIFTECTFIAWTTDFKIWCFFQFFFFLPPERRKKAQGKSIFKLQNAAIFLIYEISLFPCSIG